jgi:glycosyltransferase involved in cell wall biosynthesis
MELAMARVIGGLNGDDFRHTIACLKGEPEIEDLFPSDVEIVCFYAKPNEIRLPFRLAKLIRKICPDVIHSRNWGAWPDVCVARLLAARLRIPFIYSFHGLGKAGYMPWRRRMASKIMVHFTTKLYTVSRQSLDLMINRWGWPKDRSAVIPNGVDTSIFFPDPQPRGKKLVVGSVGNLRTVKNHALLLKACAQLVQEGLDLEIRIAGEGDQRHPLEQLANSLGLSGRLNLPGKITNIPSFLNGLDIFVLSSDSEQHPNALNEAMACGIASVATRVGCVEDLLDGGRCGKIIEPGNVNELASAIREFSLSEPLRQKASELGLLQVCDIYNLSTMINRYRDMYKSVAHKC